MGVGVSVITRNLRNGTLVLKDGSGSPKTLTVALDEGDLRWIERQQTIEILDRGVLDHTRPGDQLPVDLSFSAKWTQLLGKEADSGNALQLYEFLHGLSATGVVSTSPTGQQFTLTFEFTVADPASSNDELITFTKVFRQSLTMNEADRANLITFSGRAFITRPTITRP